MSDRTDPVDGERRSARSLTAAVVAGGLALSASLYPAPDEVPFFGSFGDPGLNQAFGLPVLVEPISIIRRAEDTTIGTHELWQLARVLVAQARLTPNDAVSVPAAWGQLLDAGDFPAAVPVSCEMYSAIFVMSGGGGGGASVGAAALPDWLIYLNFLMRQLPARIFHELATVLQRIAPPPPVPEAAGIQILALPAAPVPLPPETVPAPAPAQSVAPPAPGMPGPVTPASAAPPAPPPDPLPPAPQPAPVQTEPTAPPVVLQPAEIVLDLPLPEPSIGPVEPDQIIDPAPAPIGSEEETALDEAARDFDETGGDAVSPTDSPDDDVADSGPEPDGTEVPSGGATEAPAGEPTSG
ncbi:hypothetical protein ACAG25_11910 [Mycobacterium sp. pV006]|uniref:hypothetical protein n=1 Tax=Mycobacterium sp. pV006 TaxID=3238983 RepID=UPI00351AECE2